MNVCPSLSFMPTRPRDKPQHWGGTQSQWRTPPLRPCPCSTGSVALVPACESAWRLVITVTTLSSKTWSLCSITYGHREMRCCVLRSTLTRANTTRTGVGGWRTTALSSSWDTLATIRLRGRSTDTRYTSSLISRDTPKENATSSLLFVLPLSRSLTKDLWAHTALRISHTSYQTRSSRPPSSRHSSQRNLSSSPKLTSSITTSISKASLRHCLPLTRPRKLREKTTSYPMGSSLRALTSSTKLTPPRSTCGLTSSSKPMRLCGSSVSPPRTPPRRLSSTPLSSGVYPVIASCSHPSFILPFTSR
mmetsp:Transcript_21720/g.47253  ORF Transcript_21720/g.47253 Transcript_21720/m.47253 type:complete len:305 (-) Transcript_21720:231-1145(-)